MLSGTSQSTVRDVSGICQHADGRWFWMRLSLRNRAAPNPRPFGWFLTPKHPWTLRSGDDFGMRDFRAGSGYPARKIPGGAAICGALRPDATAAAIVGGTGDDDV